MFKFRKGLLAGWVDGWVNGVVHGSADGKGEWVYLLSGRALNFEFRNPDSSYLVATE